MGSADYLQIGPARPTFSFNPHIRCIKVLITFSKCTRWRRLQSMEQQRLVTHSHLCEALLITTRGIHNALTFPLPLIENKRFLLTSGKRGTFFPRRASPQTKRYTLHTKLNTVYSRVQRQPMFYCKTYPNLISHSFPLKNAAQRFAKGFSAAKMITLRCTVQAFPKKNWSTVAKRGDKTR